MFRYAEFKPADLPLSTYTYVQQDGSGWTPLMIAVSLKDGEEMVDLLLQKGADVNQKSEYFETQFGAISTMLNLMRRFQWPSKLRMSIQTST